MFALIRRRGGMSWADTADHVAADLEALNRSTESDFLAVGGRLSDLREAADAIRETVGRTAAGQCGEQAAEALSAVLHRSDAMRRRVEESLLRLEELRRSADGIRRGFGGLSGMALSFQVAATLGRIETARIGGAGKDLAHLGESVRASAEAISSQAQRAVEMASALEQRIAGVIARIADLCSHELKALPALARMVDESLAEFRVRRGQERASSQELAARFAAFSEAVGRVVTALQFHDITRQQVDHVVEALRAAVSGRSRRRVDAETCAVLELQRRQLTGAAASFDASSGDVLQGLRDIDGEGCEISGESKTLLGLAAGQKESFYGRMERCFGRVFQAVSRCSALESGTASAVSELRETIGNLGRCVDEIQAIGWGIHHLAINTTIEAVHLGGAGEPLSVVASAMQALQADARSGADQASCSLAAMADAVTAIAASADDGGSSDSLLPDLQAAIDRLRESGEQTVAWAGEIESASAKLREDVERATAEFQAPARFKDVADRCCESLRTLVGGTVSVASASTARELSGRYTMDAERMIHRDAAAESATFTPVEPAVAIAAAEFGDNVELF